jgi:hypothetical protein
MKPASDLAGAASSNSFSAFLSSRGSIFVILIHSPYSSFRSCLTVGTVRPILRETEMPTDLSSTVLADSERRLVEIQRGVLSQLGDNRKRSWRNRAGA